MGRVFTWDEVRRDRIPERRDFEHVFARIRQEVEDTEGILGGIFCGSVGHNTWNIRSDIDFAVLYNPRELRAVMSAFCRVNEFAAGLNVPIEFIPVDVELAATHMHTLDPSFLDHLSGIVEQTGCLKRNPLEVLAAGTVTDRDDVRSYVKFKLKTFEKALCRFAGMSDAEKAPLFQKALEVPINTARKLLRLYSVKMPDDSKASVERYYVETAGPRERELFLKIVAEDKKYTERVSKLAVRHPPQMYLGAMEYLEKEGLWDAFEFVRLVTLRLD